MATLERLPTPIAASGSLDTTLPGLLFARAAGQPGRVALREKELGVWEEITWGEYARQVRHVALGLYRLGVRRGDRVAIMADNCREWLYADLGAQALGAVTVGIHPTRLEPDVEYVLADSGSVVCIGGDQEQVDKCLSLRGALPHLRQIISISQKGLWSYQEPGLLGWAEVIALGQELDSREPGLFDQLLAAGSADDVCMILYTAGTTGPPKGVMFTHGAAMAAVDDLIAANPVRPDDTLVSYLPLAEITERVLSVLLPLRVGCVVNFAESLETVSQALFEISPSLFLGLPRIYERFASDVATRMANADWLQQRLYRWAMAVGQRTAALRLARQPVPPGLRLQRALAYWLIYRPILDKMGLRRVRLAYAGGAAMSPELLHFFHALGVPVCEAYGATELGGFTFCHRLDDLKAGTVGKPLHNVEFQLGRDGELLQRRRTGVFAGYLNRPEATAATLVDGWVKMGDSAEVDAEGNLIIIGRTRDLYRLGSGQPVSPQAIETRLKFSPYINEALVFGEGQAYNVALIQMEMATCADYARRNGIVYTTFRSLAQQPAIRELIAREVEKVNATLAPALRVQRFALLPKELNEEDGELTPTRKVRRQVIRERFGHLIEELYG